MDNNRLVEEIPSSYNVYTRYIQCLFNEKGLVALFQNFIIMKQFVMFLKSVKTEKYPGFVIGFGVEKGWKNYPTTYAILLPFVILRFKKGVTNETAH